MKQASDFTGLEREESKAKGGSRPKLERSSFGTIALGKQSGRSFLLNWGMSLLPSQISTVLVRLCGRPKSLGRDNILD